MKPLIWIALAISLVLAGCASGTAPVHQHALALAPAGVQTVSPAGAVQPLQPWEKYNLVYYPVVSF